MKRISLLFILCICFLSGYTQSTTFSYTGSVQTYTVPSGIVSLALDVRGAQGGNFSGHGNGGLGGRVVCTLAVTSGQVLQVYVGQQAGVSTCGSGSAGGSNSGGGAQGGNGATSGCGGSGGGGSSDVRTIAGSTTTSLNSRLVVGAGGGGGAWACGSEAGGAGGGLTGGLGENFCSSYSLSNNGGPGTPTAAGAAGNLASAGSFGAGGNAYTSYYGGGGGGGWYGAGGAYSGGGCGGSSYAGGAGVTGATMTSGYTTGNGVVIITPLCTNPPASTGSLALCTSGVSTLSNTVSGGTWSSSNLGVATAVTGTGAITGVSAGTAQITYNTGGGCFSTVVVTVAAAPSVSAIATNSSICAGNTLTLTGTTPANVGTFAWSGPGAITGSSTAAASVAAATTAASGIYSLTVTNGTGVGCSRVYTTSATVLAAPASIVGGGSICEGSSTILSCTTASGTWSSSNSTVATVNSTGLVDGLSSGTATISYTLSSGCAATLVVTVNALPVLNISPSTSAARCLNTPATFSAVAPGATFAWVGISGAGGISCAGCATTDIAPTATGTYEYSVTATSSAGCAVTSGVTVSVNPLPSDITGSSNLCVGTSQTLSGGTGGTWSSGSPAFASIGATTGLVTGVATGAATISYTLPTGCYKTFGLTVLPTPASIGGTLSVCTGLTTNLTHAIGGGAWSSSSTATATVSPSGVVTGVTPGNVTISYTLPSGCIVTSTATVNALPAAISGASAVCESSTVTMTNSTAGGTWSSSSTANATVNTFSGIVSGVSAGNTTISYTLSNGCYRTQAVVVNARPAAITGTMSTCHNSISVLSDATGGGSWNSSNTGVAFVDASGMVTGITPGIATISYTLSTGCQRTGAFTVNALPATIGGTQSVCVGEVTTLTNTDGGGTWSSSNSGVASVSTSGDVSGVSAGNATITYTLATGCRRTASVTVNALPVVITGTPEVCEGSVTTLYNFSGSGTWTSGATGVATVSGSGDVSGISAGLANITYTLPTGCIRTQVVTVNALPAAIGGSNAVCVGQTIALDNSTGGGSWSSSAPGTATIDASGIVSGAATGNTTITYTLPTGCSVTKSITVNGLPSNISGTGVVCEGSVMNLNNSTAGGAWSSESAATATISGSGSVSGVSAGTVTMSYTLPTGCYRTKVVTVNALPAAIGGNTQVCVGQTTTLDNATSGGTWSSSASGFASVSSTGVVSGIAAGGANISYTLSTGCRRSVAVVVNPLPAAITGSLNVCEGSTTTLNNSATGGNWETSNSSVAGISSTGIVTGVSAGTATISYILPTGCQRTAVVNVRPLPAPISGSLNVCMGSATALGNTSAGGVWSSSAAGTASVNSLGVVSGVAAGTANITYTLPTSCRTYASVVVNSLPAAISGTLSVCAGSNTTLNNGTTGGNWSSSSPSVATIDVTGQVSGITAGTATMTYTLPTGCYSTAVMTVNALPGVIMGAGTICQGSGLILSASGTGGTWSSSTPAVATISGSGIVTGMAAGASVMSYTLPTGCARTATVTVEGLPMPISGSGTVCVGNTMMLGNPTSGGIWSSASAVASVSFLGEVSGITAGTAVITYMLPSGCQRTRIITVNPLPSVSTGIDNVCTGSSIVLSNATAGGTWQSNSTALATVDATSGQVSGVSSGAALISYVLPTGCQRVKTVTVNATPATIGGVSEICNGTTTILNNTTPGGVWISGNTSVAIVGLSGGNVTGLSSGTSEVSYVLSTGCLATRTVVVNANPTAITGLSGVCVGSSTVLSNATVGGSWSISDATVATISDAGVLHGIAAGNATVTYSLGTGCNTTKLIAVNSLPSVNNVTGGGSYCAGGSGVSVGIDGSETMTTYTLYRSGVGSSIGSFTGTGTPLYFGSMLTAGMYTVTATNASGCNSNMGGSATVSITPVVTPAVSVSADMGDTVCAGTMVTFGATGVNGGIAATYEWKVNGITVTGSGSAYAYIPSNGDVITATMTSSAACALPSSVSGSKSIRVETIETPSANISVSPSASVCEGTTVTFSVSAANGGTAPAYTWMKNGTIAMGSGTTMSFIPSDNDVIVCWLNSNYRCLSVNNVPSNSITLNVDKVYIPEVQVVVTPGTTFTAGTTATFTATVSNAGPTPEYQWLKNGVVISGANGTVYVSNKIENGDSVTCMVKGSGACGEITINSVKLTVLPTTGVTVTTKGAMELSLMPNPNSGRFTVKGSMSGSANEKVELEVVDMLGQVVYRGSAAMINGSMEASIDLGNSLANGMYLLHAGTGAGRQSVHFVVKQ
jgi:trimeric autotransporter adhesin